MMRYGKNSKQGNKQSFSEAVLSPRPARKVRAPWEPSAQEMAGAQTERLAQTDPQAAYGALYSEPKGKKGFGALGDWDAIARTFKEQGVFGKPSERAIFDALLAKRPVETIHPSEVPPSVRSKLRQKIEAAMSGTTDSGFADALQERLNLFDDYEASVKRRSEGFGL
jgi:hypothetical protein